MGRTFSPVVTTAPVIVNPDESHDEMCSVYSRCREQRRLFCRLQRSRLTLRVTPRSRAGLTIRRYGSMREHAPRRRLPSTPHSAPTLDLRASTWRDTAPLHVFRLVRALLYPPTQPHAWSQFTAFPCDGGGRRDRRGCLRVPATRPALVPAANGRLGRAAAPAPCATAHTAPHVHVRHGRPDPYRDAGRRRGATFAPSQCVAAHLQLDGCGTLRTRVADDALAYSRDPRALASILIRTWQPLRDVPLRINIGTATKLVDHTSIPKIAPSPALAFPVVRSPRPMFFADYCHYLFCVDGLDL
ncbi:hypothetical protein BC826DRAFT_1038462 [Russula brevipes]|nr:hypothetical protein BC826DRAFT_1038462 [Russula brevipes]